MLIFSFKALSFKLSFFRILNNETESPTLNNIPPLPFCKISLGPTLQLDEIINFLRQAISNNIFGLPSNLELNTLTSAKEIYLYGLS